VWGLDKQIGSISGLSWGLGRHVFHRAANDAFWVSDMIVGGKIGFRRETRKGEARDNPRLRVKFSGFLLANVVISPDKSPRSGPDGEREKARSATTRGGVSSFPGFCSPMW